MPRIVCQCTTDIIYHRDRLVGTCVRESINKEEDPLLGLQTAKYGITRLLYFLPSHLAQYILFTLLSFKVDAEIML